MVEWLEQHCFGAQSRRTAQVRGWDSACDNWKTMSTQQSMGTFFLFRIRDG